MISRLFCGEVCESCLFHTPGGGGAGELPYISICGTPKGMVFEPFWSEIVYRF